MSPRPRFSSKVDTVRNAVLAVLLRPFQWFSPNGQFIIGFVFLVLATTFLISFWPYSLKTIGLAALVAGLYFVVWRLVNYRAAMVDLLVSTPRAFALVTSAILFETALMRAGFMIANAIASQSTRSPFNDLTIWGFAIPFAAASLLLTMLLDRQLSLVAGIVTALFVALLAPHPAHAALYALTSSATAAYGIKRYRERQSITVAGLLVALTNFVMAMA